MENLAPRIVAMESDAWVAFLSQLQNIDRAQTPPRPSMSYNAANTLPAGVAVVKVEGVLLPTAPEWMREFGLRVTGYDEITREMEAHAKDGRVSEIVLNIDSPGGTVQGVASAARAIREAAAAKTVTAWCDGTCASGAYWLASGASRIFANTTARIGSIGVYQAFYDQTERLTKAGIKPVVIRSGMVKGMGIDAITEEQIAAEQGNIDALASLFVEAVADGRGLSVERVNALATGQTWIGARAQAEGLTDKTLETYQVGQIVSDEEEDEMTKAIESPPAVVEAVTVDHEAARAEAVAGAVAAERARCGELVSAFAARDMDFCIAQIQSGADVATAKAEAFDRLAAAPAVEPVKAVTPAPAPLADAEHDGAAPVVSTEARPLTFNEKALAVQAAEGITYEAAWAKVARTDPDHFARVQRGESL
jgi:signal peptide peptidase SppA